MGRRSVCRKSAVRPILMGCTALLITVTGIVYRQSLLHIFPLYVSLFVALLQADANRYAPLLGGCNSALYAVVYLHLGFYASAASTFLFSCCFQLLAFVLWSKRRYRHSTQFRKMRPIIRIMAAAAFFLAFLLVCFLLKRGNSPYAILDTLLALLDATISLLLPFAWIEYAYLMPISSAISILLNLSAMATRPAQITYAIFSVYALLCRIQCLYSVRGLYALQQADIRKAQQDNGH